VLRFGIEFVRADDRGVWGSLSTSQWIALALALVAAWLYPWLRREATSATALASS
jgi:prolipoprotein diacylglyceryltransferase